ncbi:MAG: hypothetical protein M1834_003937 [Cirrosporium novae-zelandiae]|nr:MAG: hypothetical protein M1834_003937 [Cirrosporium novae-zelandiae]
MPSAIHELSPYEQVPETKEDLDWAELVTLDLGLWDKPGGKQELAKKLEHAVHHVGFFYVKNFGLSQEEVDHQFALGREFYSLPLSEKLKFHSWAALESGNYNGYRPAGHRRLVDDIYDNVEVYNIPKFDGFHERKQPKVLQDHIDEIEAFQRKIHEEVVLKLLRIFAVVLELPDEEQLVKDHFYNERGEDHLRYMFYGHRTPEENKKVGELYSPGHTDLGTVTLLFRQPVAALQILNSDNEWKWVKPQDATITINICDALSALTGGYFKSSVHRVHAPPPDQAHIDRLGVLYFARPNNNVILSPITNSPVLNRLNLRTNDFTNLETPLTTEQWVKLRQTQQQRKVDVQKITPDGKYIYKEKDLEILPGLHAVIHN